MAVEKFLIPARTGKAARVKQGQTVKVINTHGRQVVDFWAFVARDGREFMSMEHTRPAIKRLTPIAGDELMTNRRRPILKVIKDTTPGVHDTTVAACCPNRYRQLGVKGYHENCEENLHVALKALGRVPAEVPCPFNLFQNSQYSVTDELVFKPTVSKPKQYISFKALMNCVVVFSCCPMDVVPINEGGPTEAHFTIG
jgi:uncharacterized protein